MYEEPEGLTLWDLDNGQAPGIRGQLHVLLLNNDEPDPDNVSLKHYTNTLHVDGSVSDSGNGTFNSPYKTVETALLAAWDGSRISTKAGAYPTNLTISKRVQMISRGGPAVIGQ